jgi:hypothetical protein
MFTCMNFTAHRTPTVTGLRQEELNVYTGAV